jgi:hypothetical protein
MEHIRQLLRDPAWWFAAVLVGVLTSLFASYLRDLIATVGGALLESQKRRNALRTRELTDRAAALAADDTLLILQNIRHLGLGMVFFQILTVLPLLAVIFFGFPVPPTLPSQRTGGLLILFLLLIGALVAGQAASRLSRLLSEANRVHAQRRRADTTERSGT